MSTPRVFSSGRVRALPATVGAATGEEYIDTPWTKRACCCIRWAGKVRQGTAVWSGVCQGRTASSGGKTRGQSSGSSSSRSGVTAIVTFVLLLFRPRRVSCAPASRAVQSTMRGKSATTPSAPSGVSRWVTKSETWNGSPGSAEYGSAVTRKDSVAMAQAAAKAAQ